MFFRQVNREQKLGARVVPSKVWHPGEAQGTRPSRQAWHAHLDSTRAAASAVSGDTVYCVGTDL